MPMNETSPATRTRLLVRVITKLLRDIVIVVDVQILAGGRRPQADTAYTFLKCQKIVINLLGHGVRGAKMMLSG